MRGKIWLVALAGALLSLGLVSCGGGGGGGDAVAAERPSNATIVDAKPQPSTIDILDNVYSPTRVLIKVGAEVQWQWDASGQHSVTGEWDGQPLDSGLKTGNEKFVFKFEKAGEFKFHCQNHPGMQGVVVVED
jgi:plastocyanin